ncbi:MAG: hypothetical protein F4X35_00120 [Alphaproteobacteria bacterium]|nr:hypothetical protein [Alphaproteobacteria bacterium]
MTALTDLETTLEAQGWEDLDSETNAHVYFRLRFEGLRVDAESLHPRAYPRYELRLLILEGAEDISINDALLAAVKIAWGLIMQLPNAMIDAVEVEEGRDDEAEGVWATFNFHDRSDEVTV